MTANPILLQKKYARVIECFAKQQGLSLDEALGLFYHSEVYQLMRDGVSDMHCMSDAYLVLLELSETLLEVSLPHPDNKSMLIDRDTISKDLILNFIKKTS